MRIHNASTPAASRALASLFDELNAAEVEYPGTNLRLKYELVDEAEGRIEGVRLVRDAAEEARTSTGSPTDTASPL
jgi:hypothetical protein